MKNTLTTTSVSEKERLSYWLDLICSTYVRLDCQPIAPHHFDGSIEHHRLPGLELSVIKSCSQSVSRTARSIALDQEDYFIVALQTKGTGQFEQAERRALIHPGDIVVFDSKRPYDLHFTDAFEEVVLKLRGGALRALVRDVERLTAIRLAGDSLPCRMLAHAMQSMSVGEASVDPAVGAPIADAMLSFVAASLQTLSSHQPAETPRLHAYHVQRVKSFIDQHLRDSTLTIASVAAGLELSTAHLHRLFSEEEISASQYLWRQRLSNCSRDLVDAQCAKKSISEIAFSWGFNDAAHFSRAFRERFGCSPRDWRWQASGLQKPRANGPELVG